MNKKKKILIFIDWYLPGYRAGGPITSIKNLIAQLHGHFDFSIVTTDTDYHEHVPYNNIKSNQWNKLKNCEVFYLSKDKLNPAEIKRIIQETEHDYLYLNSMFSVYFSLLPLFFSRKVSKKIILAPRGMLAPGALSIKKFKKQIFLSLFRFFNLNKRVTFHATNEDEKKQVINFFPDAEVIVAPNLPAKSNDGLLSKTKKEPGKASLVSIARISPEKNLLFAIPLLSQVRGEILLNVYGSVNDQSYFQEIKREVSALPHDKKVIFHGAIEPSVIPAVFKESHFLLMPTLGENYGHIIIEALSYGCPVIISDKTPWRNLTEKKAGWDVSLDDQSKWIEILQEAVDMENKTYSILSENAVKFANEVQNDKELVKKYLHLFS